MQVSALLQAEYFDGHSARAHPVTLQRAGDELLISGEGVSRRAPLREVQWPERTRHGVRIAHLPGGGSVHCADSGAWDVWMRTGGPAESWVVRLQQSWRGVFATLLVMVALLVGIYQWGLPWAAQAVVAWVPSHVDETVGVAAMESLDEHLMKPTELPAETQQRLRAAFERALATLPPAEVPPHRIEFRKSRIGPNAFALPGGTIVMTDELVKKMAGDDAALVGVLAHELGHVRHRHGIRMLVQVGALSALSALVLGDFSAVLAGVPVWLGQASYSRDAEREADAESARVLKAAGLSPLAMVRFFEAMARPDPKQAGDPGPGRADDSLLGIAIASHPADAERIEFFREAARR
jgi:Zn-dependent protease with chaperone function